MALSSKRTVSENGKVALVNRLPICYNLTALHKHRSKPPHVRVPLRFTYRSLPDRQIIESHINYADLPILRWHIKEIRFLVKETHVSPEQALESRIKMYINAHIEEKREQFHKEEPGYHLTITISEEPTYSKELNELLELLKT
jgi:hypothetical protein